MREGVRLPLARKAGCASSYVGARAFRRRAAPCHARSTLPASLLRPSRGRASCTGCECASAEYASSIMLEAPLDRLLLARVSQTAKLASGRNCFSLAAGRAWSCPAFVALAAVRLLRARRVLGRLRLSLRARQLRERRSSASPSRTVESRFFGRLLVGMQGAAKALGIELKIEEYANDPGREAFVTQSLLEEGTRRVFACSSP